MYRTPPRQTVLAALCLVAFALSAHSQDSPDKSALDLDAKIIADALKSSEIMKNLGYLSDVIGPRLTGSANLKRANDWSAELMKQYGLQNVKLEPWEIPLGWERGTATVKLIDPDNGRSLTVCAAGWTPGTKGKITSDVKVLTIKKKSDLDQYRGKLKDAVILVGEPSKVAPVTDLSYGPGSGRKKDDKKPTERPKGELTRKEQEELQREVAEFFRTEGVAVRLEIQENHTIC